MLVKITIRKRARAPDGMESVGWIHKEIELTGNYKRVCNSRDCHDEVEITYQQKVKRIEGYPRRFWFDKRVETWEQVDMRSFFHINDIYVQTTHDHYIPTVEKE